MVVFHDVVQSVGGCSATPTVSATLKGLLAQRLAQGTHNPWVLGSNPGGPTRFFNRSDNMSGLFSYSRQWFSLANSLLAHFRATSVGCPRCRRHGTGPSTTFNLDPSTKPRISRKPQAVYLRFYFCPRRRGRGMPAKRSRWAGFVARGPRGRPGWSLMGGRRQRRPPAGRAPASTPRALASAVAAPRDSGARAPPGKFFPKLSLHRRGSSRIVLLRTGA